MKYDWTSWGMGILGAIISGVATVLATIGGVFVAGINFHQAWIVIAFAALGAIGASLGKFWSQHPTPDPVATAQKAADVANKNLSDAVAKSGNGGS